jgi:superfamily II DNA/RNA helicase
MMKSSFENLGVSPPILKSIKEMGFEEPTEVQRRTIPHILNQKDLIVISKTGSGKTAVFGISMLQMTDSGAAGPQGLILTPTRELAVQVDSDLKKMSNHLQHKSTAVYGQHSMNVEIQALNKGVSIVTGTPGRVYDHIRHKNMETKHLRFLVLDEADRMLDMGFLGQVERIIKTLPKDRVTLLFSATIPAEVRKICREYMKHPVTIEIESQTMTVDTTKQVYYRVNNNEKNIQLNRILLVEQPESCMIFCNKRITVDKVQTFLSQKGYASQALHGDIPQVRRLKTLQRFKQGEFYLLVATDVAARGIHIDDLSLVINYDVPMEKDSYVHRIGRTGRAGNGGRAITLVTGEDIMSLYEIEEHIGAMIAEAELPSEAVFNAHRASIEKWIQANSKKSPSPQAASESNLIETHNRFSRTKPQPHHEQHRNRSIEVKSDYKTAKRVNTVHPAEHAKLVHAIAKPVPPPSTEADVIHSKQSTEIVQSQTSTTKKPFLQRVLQRILGK